MSTETLDSRFKNLDELNALEAISKLAESHAAGVDSVVRVRAKIANAVDEAKKRLLTSDGRLIYAGAGTSGRVAVQDGVELYPTFGWPQTRLEFLIAGGQKALMYAVENAEDDYQAGFEGAIALNLNQNDVVLGIAASGRTPYTLGVIAAANSKGALTIGLSNNAETEILKLAQIGIFLDSGAEAIAGSTRLKAGTSQKVALNTFSTALMIALGGVYKGMMVGMVATNAKLRNRAVRIIISITNCNEENALTALKETNFDIKSAALLIFGVKNENQRRELLSKNHGDLAKSLKELGIE